MDSPRRQRSISLCQPHSTTPHPSRVGVPTRLLDALGCRPSTAGGQGATLSTFPLVPLTREPTCTQAIDPGISRSTLTPADTSRPSQSSGHFPDFPWPVPHGWPMVHHSMATGFPIPRGCCLALSASLPFPRPNPLLPHPGTGPFPASRGLPTPSGRCAALATRPSPPRPLVPSSRVYTPPGRLLPCGAGPLGPLPFADRFVRLAQVAPFPPPSLSPVPRPRANPLGCLAAPSHPSSRVYTPTGRHQPCGAGPLDPHPSGNRFVRLARVAPFPPPPLFPCAAAPAYSSGLLCGPIPSLIPCVYPTGPPATLWRGPTGSSSIRGPFRAPSTCRSPPAPTLLSCAVSHAVLLTWGRRVALATRLFLSRLLVVLRGVVRVCFLFFFLLFFFAWFPPPCMHAQQHCTAICLGSVRCSRPVPPPSCGAALGGPRPCRATQPFSRRCCTRIGSLSSLPSPPLCPLPALLVLFSCSVCSPLVVSAPWLYLARPHAPQGLRPVFRPVGQPGWPPQTPLRGDSPVVLSRRLPLHQFPDGRAGRPVRLYAGHRHGSSL